MDAQSIFVTVSLEEQLEVELMEKVFLQTFRLGLEGDSGQMSESEDLQNGRTQTNVIFSAFSFRKGQHTP